jgi:hypothetical protein
MKTAPCLEVGVAIMGHSPSAYMAGRKRSKSTGRKPRRKRSEGKHYRPAEPLQLTSEQVIAGLQKIVNRMSEHRRREFIASLAERGDLLEHPAQSPKPARHKGSPKTKARKSV